MRIASGVLGIVGGLSGIAFAQMVVSLGLLMSVIAAQTAETDLGPEFTLGVVATLVCALGVAGAVVVLSARALVGAALLLIASLVDLIVVLAISGGPELGGRPLVIAAFPFIGPLLLFVACALAALTVRPRVASVAPAPATPEVTAHPAHLASAVPLPLLAEPMATAATQRELPPGTAFDTFEQRGEFVHVRGDDFDGYLPAWSVRRAA